MSEKNVRYKETGDNFGGQIQNNVYEGIDFDNRFKDAERRLNTRINKEMVAVKKRYLILGGGILVVVMIALIVVGGVVVYNMSKCQECQPTTQQSPETQQHGQTDQKELYATYIRWGRTICPNVSTTVYNGYASGAYYKHSGGSSQTICLPKDPEFGSYHLGRDDASFIYNAEYQGYYDTNIFEENLDDQDVPCAVCEVKGKSAILMIPARMECYDGWTKEYSGYLMTSYHTHYRSSMKCVDEAPEKIRGQSGNKPGDQFYLVEPAGTLPDPPFTRGVELTCVVCTK